MALSEFNHYFQEEKISTDERKKLEDSQFGIPSLRKYPLTDEKHVEQAVRFFNKADPQYKPELARNIVKRAKELNMEWWNWFEKGRKMYPYLKSLSKSDQKLVKNKLSGKPIKEAYADELNSPPEAEACIYALKDVAYDTATPQEWKLKSPDEVLSSRKGNCHDTAYFCYKMLDVYAKKPVSKGIVFFIEYNPETEVSGSTHSICYENIPNGICKIECSWEGWKGTFPYNNLTEMIDVIYKNWEPSSNCTHLLCAKIDDVEGIHPGMNLAEYVEYVMNHCEKLFERELQNNNNIES